MAKLFTIDAKVLKTALDTLSKATGAKVAHVHTDCGYPSVSAYGSGIDCVCLPLQTAQDAGTGEAVIDLAIARRVLKGLPGSVTISVEDGPCGPVTLFATPFPADVTARGKVGETKPVQSVPRFITNTTQPVAKVRGLVTGSAIVDCCVDPHASRYALGNICFNASRSQIAASDGKRLAWIPVTVETVSTDFPEMCLIPPAVCSALNKTATVTITEIAPARFILTDGSLFACFENPGRFPKYHQIIDDNSKLNLAGTVRGDRFFDAVDSADTSLSADGTNRCVDISANGAFEVKARADRKAVALPWLNSGRHENFAATLDAALLAPWLKPFKKSGTVEVYAPSASGSPLRFACGPAQLIIMPLERN